jgi:putative hydroxymethylpyrimidine transport system substrate-binding protein
MGILRIGLEWFKNPDHVPFFIAEELGWLAEVNIQTELIVPDFHLDALQVILGLSNRYQQNVIVQSY